MTWVRVYGDMPDNRDVLATIYFDESGVFVGPIEDAIVKAIDDLCDASTIVDENFNAAHGLEPDAEVDAYTYREAGAS